MTYFTVFILSLFLTISLVPVFKSLALKLDIVDHPDARKVHAVPMPKTGGVSMALGAFIPILFWVTPDPFVHSVMAGALIIVIFGLLDDIRPLTPLQKIIPQAGAALLVIACGGVRISYLGELLPFVGHLHGSVSTVLTLIVILGITNAVNLSDGLDGLAGGISMLSFVMILFLAVLCGNIQVAVMTTAVIGAIAGFLRYNTHPAVLFMGDAGSQLLGFLSIVFAIVITQGNTPYSRALSLPIIGFPILDTLMVMTERIMHKRSPFAADKNHFHHRLMRTGLYHTESVLIIYLLQSCFVAHALIFRFHSEWHQVAGFIVLSLVALSLIIRADARSWDIRKADGLLMTTKRRLARLKEKKVGIRVCFGILRYGFPLILFCQVVRPPAIPLVMAPAGGVFLLLTAAACFIPRLHRFRRHTARACVFLLVPLILYIAEACDPGLPHVLVPVLNNAAFMALALGTVFTLNLTRRTLKMKVTPMDILMIIVALVLPNLPTLPFHGAYAGAALAKALILFFCFDVLAGELRGNFKGLAGTALAFSAAVVLRASLG